MDQAVAGRKVVEGVSGTPLCSKAMGSSSHVEAPAERASVCTVTHVRGINVQRVLLHEQHGDRPMIPGQTESHVPTTTQSTAYATQTAEGNEQYPPYQK